ncbi:saccharopine dehydrogenase NADP-binding domain-containing protein [Halogeometricum sp. S1BR25-6]|uniref:Saccharopine dehydrogenase NADP-binding domain-containing protein n=1 Tax=Halogeometricum salsisoli TaxID=2950536 RepID=A0ABU2GKW7_9EURY|nr:saccharopine dehydrogenase NADP-binding domain-containing protein [Halogeometricum sp. S1BR25-6]MDS0301462.1 saccharopine dehydrogenase NADP-binding domain-containing protein [Halogeometricum sp. S1BR25-6]
MTTLIVGGYGSVGRTVAEELATAPDDPSAVIIAGRDGTKANAVASKFGDHVSGVAFDFQETDSYARVLEDLDQVVMCVDQSGTTFVEACLERESIRSTSQPRTSSSARSNNSTILRETTVRQRYQVSDSHQVSLSSTTSV